MLEPSYDYPVVLIQAGMDRDWFAGVDRLLAEDGIACARVLPDQPSPRLTSATRVVVVSEARSVMSRLAIRQAARTGAVVVYVRCDARDESVLCQIAELLGRKLVIMDMFHEEPKTRLARALVQIVRRELTDVHGGQGGARAEPGCLCRARLPEWGLVSARPVVVNCVVCQESPVGGVSTWAMRLARGFADQDLGFDVRTLFIATDPEAYEAFRESLVVDNVTDVCVIDPADDQSACLANVRRSIERLSGGVPAVVMPNYSDITYAASMQLACRGAKVLAIAHTDDAYYRSLFDIYTRCDGAVGVSEACVEWIRGKWGGRVPCERIVYGVPIAEAPRVVESDGPLKVAYIGRMVQTQKRIADLLHVVDELERLGVEFVLNMVGDGPDLAGWRREWEARGPQRGRVEFHGRQDPAWVQTFLSGIDVSVLVSESEGTSITMLEAMGAGVVPAVTAVSSGVDEWVVDGESGVVVPIGEPRQMARHLAELAQDRSLLQQMGDRAWRRARESVSIDAMCRRYATVFARLLQQGQSERREPNDHGVRLQETWRWSKTWCEDRAGTKEQLDEWLSEAGYRRPAWGRPMPGCDVVVVDSEREAVSPTLRREMQAWRAEGMGVVVWPHLLCADAESGSVGGASPADRLVSAVESAMRGGCRRIVVYGVGKHTRRVPEVFRRGLPIVGFMDDRMPPWEMMFGLPIVESRMVMERLRPDAVVLSSDAWEEAMWGRTRALREAGVRVIALYGKYEGAERLTAVSA